LRWHIKIIPHLEVNVLDLMQLLASIEIVNAQHSREYSISLYLAQRFNRVGLFDIKLDFNVEWEILEYIEPAATLARK